MRFKTGSDTHQSMSENPKMKCPVWSSVTNKSEGKMYGILLESIQFYVTRDVGQDTWSRILEHAGIKNMIFTTHDTYKDEVMVQLAKSCAHVTKTKDTNEWMTFFGTCFVEFCSGYGYDKLLRVAGRNYRDFLHGIDNIHEIIRFSYPRLQSPSFLVLSEDSEGCVLLYQSKRHGFKYYVKGQLQQCAKKFYDVAVNISLIEEVFVEGRTHVKFRLDFDNSVYTPATEPDHLSGKKQFSSLTGDRFLKVFPFCIVFNSQLIIKNVGPSMAAFLKEDNLVGCSLREKFLICRPLIPCVWSKILRFQGVIFELEYISGEDEFSDLDNLANSSELSGLSPAISPKISPKISPNSEKSFEERILLRGEMKYIKEWDRVAFLCTPLINNLNHLQKTGLYINDLNMFDMSRDMVMAGWQYASQLERSIEKQRGESGFISRNMKEIEEWKKRSNSLLYAMIPQTIADRLKSGEKPINTCEVFDNVTIMFNYMVGFADICANATPMEIVTCINDVFILFDKIVDKYDVFKVETLGDAVYMVAGGVPDRSPDHAINVAGLALELQEKAKSLLDPMSTSLNTRIGMHTGSVVGGVVGRRMPQYCLFGDTVNTASRMQTYSMPGRIHLSEPCYECLKESDFVTVDRGTVNIKGKGEMKTYWLAGKAGEAKTRAFVQEIATEKSHSVLKPLSSYDNALDLHGMHASTSSAQISLDFAQRVNSTTNLSQKSPSKSTLNSENSFVLRKLPRAGTVQQLEQTPEEKEPEDLMDDIRLAARDDIPVINICEPNFDTPVYSPDDMSCDSVSFFLTTDDTHSKHEGESDSGVSVSDVLLDLPSQTNQIAKTSDTFLETLDQIQKPEEIALLKFEEPLVTSGSSNLRRAIENAEALPKTEVRNADTDCLRREKGEARIRSVDSLLKMEDYAGNEDDLLEPEHLQVIEDDSCLNFSSCPLFSSLFQSSALRCSPCGYFPESSEDEKTDEAILVPAMTQSHVPVISEQSVGNIRRKGSSKDTITDNLCTKPKSMFSCIAIQDDILKPSMTCKPVQPAFNPQLPSCFQTTSISENSNFTVDVSKQTLDDPLNRTSHLPEWLKDASKETSCTCVKKANNTHNASLDIYSHHDAKEQIATSSLPEACQCAMGVGRIQPLMGSAEGMYRQCTKRKSDLSQVPNWESGSGAKHTFSSSCDRNLINSDDTLACPVLANRPFVCNTSPYNTPSDRRTPNNDLEFQSAFLSCEKGKCLDKDVSGQGNNSAEYSREYTPKSHLQNGNPYSSYEAKKTKAAESKTQVSNGSTKHIDAPKNGIVTDFTDSCLLTEDHRTHQLYNKSFSAPDRDLLSSGHTEMYHRCHSDPNTRSTCDCHKTAYDSKAESSV